MTEYHKINSLYKRDHETNALIAGDWSIPEFEYLQHNVWEFTEKVDGTNIRVIYNPETGFQFRGRTDNAQLPSQLVAKLESIFLPKQAGYKELFQHEIVLYGEGYGAKIQKVGSLYRKDQDFVLFDVRVGRWWFMRDNVKSIGKELGLDVVPIIGQGTLADAEKMVIDGLRSTWGEFEAEGIVARPQVEFMSRAGNRIIAKIKGVDYTKDIRMVDTGTSIRDIRKYYSDSFRVGSFVCSHTTGK